MKKRNIIFSAVAGAVALFISSVVYADGPWTGDIKENVLRGQAESASLKFCEKYPNLAASKKFVEANKPSTYSQMQSDMSHDWICRTISFVEEVLAENPPTAENAAVREDAFLLLDYPTYADTKGRGAPEGYVDAWRAAIKKAYGNSVLKIAKEVLEAKVESGIRVWKLYNCGFIIKSADACIGIDLRSYYPLPFSKEEISAIVKNIDALFITHAHRDHFDPDLVKALLKAGKVVVAPNPEAISSQATLAATKDGVASEDLAKKYPQFIKLYQMNSVAKMTFGNLNISAYGGSQGRIKPNKIEGKHYWLNNVYCIEIGGVKIMHCGDNSVLELYDEIGKTENVDLSFVTIWAQMSENIMRSKPKALITMHENELGHLPGFRVSYRWIPQERKMILAAKAPLPPMTTLTSGESFSYSAPKKTECAASCAVSADAKAESKSEK